MINTPGLCVCARTPHTPHGKSQDFPVCVQEARAHTATTSATPTFLVTLRPVDDALPPEIRLRGALKHVLRRHGLRCVNFCEQTPTDAAKALTGPTETRGNTENGSGHHPALTRGRIADTARVGKDAGRKEER